MRACVCVCVCTPHVCRCVHVCAGVENARFASACTDAGLVFIGPSCSSLDLFGDKIKSRKLAIEAGVPVVPGSDHAIFSAEELTEYVAKEMPNDFPVIIKAAMGGGGRGIRVVRNTAGNNCTTHLSLRAPVACWRCLCMGGGREGVLVFATADTSCCCGGVARYST